MSELLRVACEETKSGNCTVKQQVRDIGNKFLNAMRIYFQRKLNLSSKVSLNKITPIIIIIIIIIISMQRIHKRLACYLSTV